MPFRRAATFVPILLVFLLLCFIPTGFASTLVDKQKEIEKIQEEIERNKTTLDAAQYEYEQAFVENQTIDASIAENVSELAETQSRLAGMRQRFSRRVVYVYKQGPASLLSILAFSQDFSDFASRMGLLSSLLNFNAQELKETDTKFRQLEQQRDTLARQKARKADAMALRMQKLNSLNGRLAQRNAAIARLNYEIAQAKRPQRPKVAMALYRAQGSGQLVSRGTARTGFVFPVAGANEFINSWGFSRSGGRRHQGTDIMASRGTPLVACASGVIKKTSPRSVSLGGITIWLTGDDGNTYYYAHMNSIAPGIAKGTRVSAGQPVGTVGSTGNASGGAPHLHFEVHPGGGRAVNPYPILKQARGR